MGEPYVIVGYGERILAEKLTGETTQLVAFGLELVSLDRGRAVFLGPFVVLEIQFREGTEEIRVGKIWFCLDGLVEILYGEHVVVHREDVASYCEHLLGVYLRHGRSRSRQNQGKYAHQVSHHRKFTKKFANAFPSALFFEWPGHLWLATLDGVPAFKR